MTNSPSLSPSLSPSDLAQRVAINSAKMAEGALKHSDPSRVADLLEHLGSPSTIRFCDLLHAIGVALSIQADITRSTFGSSRAEAVSTVAAAAAIIAHTIETTDLPPPGDLH